MDDEGRAVDGFRDAVCQVGNKVEAMGRRSQDHEVGAHRKFGQRFDEMICRSHPVIPWHSESRPEFLVICNDGFGLLRRSIAWCEVDEAYRGLLVPSDVVRHLDLDGVVGSAGTQHGDVHRLRGEGLPRVNRSDRGDLFAHVRIEVPKKLSKRQRELLQALADEGGVKTKTRHGFFDRIKSLFERPADEDADADADVDVDDAEDTARD